METTNTPSQEVPVSESKTRVLEMAAELEQVKETTEVMETTNTPSQEVPVSESKTRARGLKVRGRGGRMGGRGGRGMMMKGFRPPGHVRGRGRDGFTNGFGPMRRGMGRTWPYPDMRGRRGGPMGMNLGPPPPPPLPPPPMHMRGPPPPMHRHCPPPPPPPGHPGFRGRPPHPRGRSMMPPGRFFHPRGYHNGSAPPLPRPPPGRGQRWPGPPGGRRF